MTRDPADDGEDLPEEPGEETPAEPDADDSIDGLASAILNEPQVDVTQLYFNEIGQAALLTADEEVALSRRVKLGDFEARQTMIERNLHISLSLYGEYFIFTRPIALAMFIFVIVTAALPFVRSWRRKRAQAMQGGAA